MTCVNMTGGADGVKLTWSECETENKANRSVECCQRLLTGLNGQKMVVFDTLGTPRNLCRNKPDGPNRARSGTIRL